MASQTPEKTCARTTRLANPTHDPVSLETLLSAPKGRGHSELRFSVPVLPFWFSSSAGRT
jgi:hypothetical protein